MQNWITGAAGVILLAAIAWLLAPHTPLNALLLALLLGFLIGQLLPVKQVQSAGVRWFESQGLSIAVALLGVQFSVQALVSLNLSNLLLIVSSLLLTLGLTWVLGKWFKLGASGSWLLASGQGICGSAAVMAVQNVVKAPIAQAGLVVAVVNFLGFVGVFLAPMLAHQWLAGESEATGLLLGNTLQSMGHVVAAGSQHEASVLPTAVLIKMCRILFLIPLLLGCLYLHRNQAKQTTAKPNDQVPSKVSWWRLIPWFIWVFLGLVVLANVLALPLWLTTWLGYCSDAMFGLAMVAIGMSIQLRDLWLHGGKILLVGSLVFVAQLGFNLLLLQT